MSTFRPGRQPQLGPLDQQQVLDAQLAQHVEQVYQRGADGPHLARRRKCHAVTPARESAGQPTVNVADVPLADTTSNRSREKTATQYGPGS